MFWDKKNKKQDASTETMVISTDTLVRLFSDSADVIFNHIKINDNAGMTFTVAHIEGMINTDQLNNDILKPLIQEKSLGNSANVQEVINKIMLGTVYHYHRNDCRDLDECLAYLLKGSILLVIDETNSAIAFEAMGVEKRSLMEPANENVLKGSKEAFIEVLRVNTALVRRRIQAGDLKIHHLTVGKRTKTAVGVVFIDSIANPMIVSGVKDKLGQLCIDGVSTVGQIENILKDAKHSIFPQLLYTERVDRFCASLLEGRVGILIDGFPNALILPVDLSSFLQAPEDYSGFIASSFFRLLRFVSAFVSLTIPAVYVSVTSFHQEMIPTELAVSIIQSKQGVPFPTFIEVALMLFAFEILLEAGLRLPKAVGQTVSIVGALVVGEAAITAKILSPGVVIVIATAGITGFVIPSQDLADTIRMLRLILVVFSIFGGLFGVTIGLILMLYHLCTLEVFGVPYLSPFVSMEGKEMLQDTIIRMPWGKMNKRPVNISPKDPKRQGDMND